MNVPSAGDIHRCISGVSANLLDGIKAAFSALRNRDVLRWLTYAAGIAMTFVGIVVLVEVAVRHTNGYGEVFEPFGLHMTFGNPLTYVISAVALGVGIGTLYLVSKKEEL